VMITEGELKKLSLGFSFVKKQAGFSLGKK
jgi:hypothetical protein